MYTWVVFNWSVEFYVRPRDKQTSEYTTNEWYFYLLHFVIGSASLLLLKKKKRKTENLILIHVKENISFLR